MRKLHGLSPFNAVSLALGLAFLYLPIVVLVIYSFNASRLIAEPANTVLVSAASAWEIATKVRIGKLPGAVALVADFEGLLVREGFETLAVSVDHAIRAGQLPGAHRDPFDRMLVAQALAETVPLISNEVVFDSFAVRRVW